MIMKITCLVGQMMLSRLIETIGKWLILAIIAIILASTPSTPLARNTKKAGHSGLTFPVILQATLLARHLPPHLFTTYPIYCFSYRLLIDLHDIRGRRHYH